MGMSKPLKRENRSYIKKCLYDSLEQYANFYIASLDNVKSKQLIDIRKCLRNKASMFVFKKSTLRCLLRYFKFNDKKNLKNFLLQGLRNNVVFVASNTDIIKLNTIFKSLFKPAYAKVGGITDRDIWIKKGSTNIDPSYTSFFQSLGIATRVSKGSIEVLNNTVLIKKKSNI